MCGYGAGAVCCETVEGQSQVSESDQDVNLSGALSGRGHDHSDINFK